MDVGDVGDWLPQPTALCLFRVAQEALQNALRHAEARSVKLTLRRSKTSVQLRVRDDGRGFHVPPQLLAYTERGHFGLAGLAERVTLAGGA